MLSLLSLASIVLVEPCLAQVVEKAKSVEMATQFWLQGYKSTAESLLKKVVNKFPDDLNTRTDLAQLLVEQKKYKEALPYVSYVLTINPYNRMARICRATIYDKTAAPAKALVDLLALRKFWGLRLEDQYLLANTLARLGRKQESDIEFGKSEKLKQVEPGHTKLRKEVLDLVRMASSDKAIAKLDRLAADNPRDYYYDYLKAGIYKSLNKPEGVIQLCTKLLSRYQLKPESIGSTEVFRTYEMRGFAYAEIGQNQKALADLTKHLSLYPGDDGVYIFRAGVYNGLGQYSKALQDLKYVERIGSRFSRRDGYAMMSALYMKLGKDQEALKVWEKGFLEGDNSAMHRRASYHADRKEWPAAVEDLSRLLVVQKNVPSVLVDRGIAYSHLGKLDLALKDLTKAVNSDPKRSKRARRERARIYDRLGKSDLARKDRDIASKQTGDNTMDF